MAGARLAKRPIRVVVLRNVSPPGDLYAEAFLVSWTYGALKYNTRSALGRVATVKADEPSCLSKLEGTYTGSAYSSASCSKVLLLAISW